ncbi:unnamed protein product [Pleuronectes platessa]|uniref:Secreted protein n=1 Tax=Pleuronectes platessa TaxID=8262 RepID=A0A9N7TU86_PLEPL|nr:unnamed protein product [Pleuronectes platessa]
MQWTLLLLRILSGAATFRSNFGAAESGAEPRFTHLLPGLPFHHICGADVMRAASKCHNSWSGAACTRQQRHVRARVRAAPAGWKPAVDPWEGALEEFLIIPLK